MKKIIIMIITIINIVIIKRIWLQSIIPFRFREGIIVGEIYEIICVIVLKILITFVVSLLMFMLIVKIDKKIINN